MGRLIIDNSTPKFTSETVNAYSELLHIKWNGELKGELNLQLLISKETTEIKADGAVRRIGGYDINVLLSDECFTLIDMRVGKLKLYVSNIEWEDKLPKQFRIKLLFESALGGLSTLVSKKISLIGISGCEADVEKFIVNSSPDKNDIIILLHCDDL